MPSLDQLPPDRRAIIELVVGRGQSYADLSERLGMPESRVREHAREALASLAPRSSDRVDPHWRAQVADYVLGQQQGPEARATRSHLRSSEAARTWAVSVLDSVGHLYPNGAEPQVPSAARGGDEPPTPGDRPRGGRRSAARAPAPPARATRESLSPEAWAVVRRRRIAAAVAGLAVVAGLVVLATQVLGGDDAEPETAETDSAAQPEILAQLQLEPVGGGEGAGGAVVAEQGGQPILLLRAKLPPAGQGETYVAWLFNSRQDAVPVAVPQADRRGNVEVIAPLPAEFEQYESIDVSLQRRSDRAQHSGRSVLRASLAGAEPTDDTGGVAPEVPDLTVPDEGG